MMRGTKAKKIRTAVYGDMSPRHRQYRMVNGPHTRTVALQDGKTTSIQIPGTVVADNLRRVYQHAKRNVA